MDFSVFDFNEFSKPKEKIAKAQPRPIIEHDADVINNLIFRPTFNKKRTVRFLSIRKWSSVTKNNDLELLKSLKARCEELVIKKISQEFFDILDPMLKNWDGVFCTSPPPSKVRPKHFATEIAKGLSAIACAEYVQIFKERLRGTSSHPAHWDERGDLEFFQIPDKNKKLCVLVDDVATSGTTLEECSAKIGEYVPVLSITWVYENLEG